MSFPPARLDHSPQLKLTVLMKTFKYVLLAVFISMTAVSCTEEYVAPTNNEDLPIVIPPPPKP
jgi:hypothetical protein